MRTPQAPSKPPVVTALSLHYRAPLYLSLLFYGYTFMFSTLSGPLFKYGAELHTAVYSLSAANHLTKLNPSCLLKVTWHFRFGFAVVNLPVVVLLILLLLLPADSE